MRAWAVDGIHGGCHEVMKDCKCVSTVKSFGMLPQEIASPTRAPLTTRSPSVCLSVLAVGGSSYRPGLGRVAYINCQSPLPVCGVLFCL